MPHNRNRKTSTTMEHHQAEIPTGSKSRKPRRARAKAENKKTARTGNATQTIFEHQTTKVKQEDASDTPSLSRLPMVKEEEEEEGSFNFSNLAQSLPHCHSHQNYSQLSTTPNATLNDNEAMAKEISALNDQISQLPQLAIKEEQDDNSQEFMRKAQLLSERTCQADDVAQNYLWDYLRVHAPHFQGLDLQHLRLHVDLQVVTAKLRCAYNLDLSIQLNKNLQNVPYDRQQLRIFSFFQNLLKTRDDWTPTMLLREAKEVDTCERRNIAVSSNSPTEALAPASQTNSIQPPRRRHLTRWERKARTKRLRLQEKFHNNQQGFDEAWDEYLMEQNAIRTARIKRNQERSRAKAQERLERNISKHEQKAMYAEKKATDNMLSRLMGMMDVDVGVGMDEMTIEEQRVARDRRAREREMKRSGVANADVEEFSLEDSHIG